MSAACSRTHACCAYPSRRHGSLRRPIGSSYIWLAISRLRTRGRNATYPWSATELHVKVVSLLSTLGVQEKPPPHTPLGLLDLIQLGLQAELHRVVVAGGVGGAGLVQGYALQGALRRALTVDGATGVGPVAVFNLHHAVVHVGPMLCPC